MGFFQNVRKETLQYCHVNLEHACLFIIYLGQHNDARMNIAIALTAARMGATLANHTEVLDLIKMQNEDGEEEVRGARLRDLVSGEYRKYTVTRL